MNPVIDNRNKYWFNEKGQLHRTDGPAFERSDGYKEWYLNETELSEDLFLILTKGPVQDLPLYLGQDFNLFISERIKGQLPRA